MNMTKTKKKIQIWSLSLLRRVRFRQLTQKKPSKRPPKSLHRLKRLGVIPIGPSMSRFYPDFILIANIFTVIPTIFACIFYGIRSMTSFPRNNKKFLGMYSYSIMLTSILMLVGFICI